MNDDNPLNFPKAADKARIERYSKNDKIYKCDHFEAFNIKVGTDANGVNLMSQRYAKLRYVAVNFAGLMSRVLADMLFGEALTIDVHDKDTQNFIDSLLEDNQLMTQLHESEMANSRRGDACFKIRVDKRHPNDPNATVIIEEFSAANYFPVITQDSTRNTPRQDVIATVFKRGNVTYLHKEIHEPGWIYNEVWNYDPSQGKLISQENVENFGYVQAQPTGVSRSLVFHIPNLRDGSGFFGTDDYYDLESIFFSLNNRVTSVDNILDKHGDPILAVPPGVLNEEGQVNKAALGMFEVDNENPGFNKPEYIVWNANLDSAFKQIDKLIELATVIGELSPDSIGVNNKDGGTAESGRALKFKLLATIRKSTRKQRYYDQAIKDMIETAQELAIFHKVTVNGMKPGKVERPTIKWSDGVMNDIVEQTDVEIKRVDAGIQTRAGAIANLDDVTPDEAAKKVAEIDKEEQPNVPPVFNGKMPDDNSQPDKNKG